MNAPTPVDIDRQIKLQIHTLDVDGQALTDLLISKANLNMLERFAAEKIVHAFLEILEEAAAQKIDPTPMPSKAS